MSKYRIKIDGKVYEMEVEAIDGSLPVAAPKAAPVAATPVASAPTKQATPKAVAAVDGAVVAPMPGTIVKILKAEGEAVKAGEAVLVLEAMKMENEIAADKDGVVKSIAVSQGEAVAKDAALFVIE